MTFLEIHDDGYIELLDQLPKSVKASLLGLLRGYWVKSRIYGEDGVAWRTAPAPGAAPKPTLFLRVLANTVYNPTRSVPVTCVRAGDYALAELKARIAKCVARDDDILTQFMEAAEIREHLGRAETFGEVVALVRRMQG